MGTGNLAILEAQILHRLSSIMAQERQLHALALQHPLIDSAHFDDFRLALSGCNREFLRIHQPAVVLTDWDAAIESMAPERG